MAATFISKTPVDDLPNTKDHIVTTVVPQSTVPAHALRNSRYGRCVAAYLVPTAIMCQLSHRHSCQTIEKCFDSIATQKTLFQRSLPQATSSVHSTSEHVPWTMICS